MLCYDVALGDVVISNQGPIFLKIQPTTICTGTGGHNRSALSGNILAVCGSYNTGITLFTLFLKKSRTRIIPGSGQIRSICTHPDGDICLLDTKNSKVCKYRVYGEEDPQLVWECNGVELGYAICCDE